MDDPLIFIGPLIGGLILYAIISVVVRSPGSFLRTKFQSLGTLRGKSFQTIVASVGPPTSRSGAANGKTLYQWMATGYHIALIFDGDICEGVTHEFANCASLAVSPARAEQPPAPIPAPVAPPQPEEQRIPCPLCAQSLKVSSLKQGENWCPHCFEKFIVE
jgi:hypothetical protein